jgi:hypothetical protein
MSKNRSQRKEEVKKAVLRDLELLAQDRHPRNQTLLARFTRCKDFQKATNALATALGAVGAGLQHGPPCLGGAHARIH